MWVLQKLKADISLFTTITIRCMSVENSKQVRITDPGVMLITYFSVCNYT